MKEPLRPVVFVHIPKTAGMTVRALVRRHYRHVVEFRRDKEHAERVDLLERLFPDERTRLRTGVLADAYMGHIPYGIHEVLECDVRYFTFVRHPVARVRSAYDYLRRTTDGHRERDARVPLEQFALERHPPNGMARQLAGPSATADARPDDDELLERALAHMRSMVAVGVQEHFELSLALLSRRLSWRVPIYRSLNRRPPEHDHMVPPQLAEAIMEREAVDMALFDSACRDLERAAASVRARKAAIRLVNDPRLVRLRPIARRLIRPGIRTSVARSSTRRAS